MIDVFKKVSEWLLVVTKVKNIPYILEYKPSFSGTKFMPKNPNSTYTRVIQVIWFGALSPNQMHIVSSRLLPSAGGGGGSAQSTSPGWAEVVGSWTELYATELFNPQYSMAHLIKWKPHLRQ